MQTRKNQFLAAYSLLRNGAVCGALLGCKLGFSKLPVEWVEGLVHKEFFAARVEALCQLLGI
jgi:hypothetical protein